MKSLRRRLLIWLLPAALLAGLLASAATYWSALSELNEVLNDQLKGIAQHVVVEPDGHLTLRGMQGANEDRLSGEQSHTVLLQVWRGTTAVFSTDRDSSLPPPRAAGFSDIAVNGQVWHTYVERNGDLLVRIVVTARGNADGLRILLNNLVDNAIRYAGAHARVDVIVGREGGCAMLEVRDTGPGIPEEDRARVWERFYRGEGHIASGSGLGLSIVKRIAEQHHAHISLGSGEDHRGLAVILRFQPASDIPHVLGRG